jgi:hypothetical protein
MLPLVRSVALLRLLIRDTIAGFLVHSCSVLLGRLYISLAF